MDPEFQCHAMPCPEAIISYNEFMGGVTSSEVTTVAAQQVESVVSIYSLYLMLPLPMHLYCTSTTLPAQSSRTSEIFVCSWRRSLLVNTAVVRGLVGRGFLKNLPLRCFPVKLESADATRCNRHRCTRCLDKYTSLHVSCPRHRPSAREYPRAHAQKTLARN